MTTDENRMTRRLAVEMITHAARDAQSKNEKPCNVAARINARRWLHGGYGHVTFEDCIDILELDQPAVFEQREYMLTPEFVGNLRVSKVVV